MSQINIPEIETFKQEVDKLSIDNLKTYKEYLWGKYQEVKLILQFKEEFKEVAKHG